MGLFSKCMKKEDNVIKTDRYAENALLMSKEKSSIQSLNSVITEAYTILYPVPLSRRVECTPLKVNHLQVSFEVFAVVILKALVFWVVTPCSFVGRYQHF